MQEVALVPQLSLVNLDTSFEMHATFLKHFSNLRRVHLLVVDAYIPDRPGRTRRSTNDPVWLQSPLESPSVMAVRLLKEVLGSSIWTACSQVHGMEPFDVEVAP